MVETTVVRTIRVRGTSEGIDKLTGDLNKLAGAQTNVAVVAEEQAKRFISAAAAYKNQTLRLDENARVQDRIAQATKVADRALKEGLISQQQHAERLTLIQQRYNNVIDATDKFAKSSGLARHELINLGRQAQDVGVSLISGQSPFMVLAQQGSQIADVFISSGKSVGAFFTQASAWALRFATSTAGVVTGIAAIGAAVVALRSNWAEAQTEINRTLIGPGRASGASRDDINRIAADAAAVSKQSVGEARELALALAETGKIGVEQIASLTKHGYDFAKVLGVDLPEANKILAQSFADPAKGVDIIGDKLGGFTARMRSEVKLLAAGFRFDEARKQIEQGMIPTLNHAGEAVGTFGRIWDGTWKIIKDSGAAINTAIDKLAGNGPLLERIASAQSDVSGLQGAIARRGERARPSPIDTELIRNLAMAQDRLAKLNDELNRLKADRLGEIRNAAIALGDSLDPAPAKIEQMRAALEGLNNALANTDVLKGMSDTQVAQATRARDILQAQVDEVDRLKGKYGDLNTDVSRQVELLQLQQQMALATNDAQRALIQLEMQRLQLKQQNLTAVEQERLATEQMNVSMAQLVGQTQQAAQARMMAAQQAVAAAKMEATAAGLSPAQGEKMRLEFQMMQQILQGLIQQYGAAGAAAIQLGNQQALSAQLAQGAYEQLVQAVGAGAAAAIKAGQDVQVANQEAVNAYNARVAATQAASRQIIQSYTEEAYVARQSARQIADANELARRQAARRARDQEELNDNTVTQTQRQTEAQRVYYIAVNSAADAWNAYNQGLVDWSAANDEAGAANRRMTASLYAVAKATDDARVAANRLIAEWGKFVPFSVQTSGGMPFPFSTQTWEKNGSLTQFNPAGYQSGVSLMPETSYGQKLADDFNKTLAGGVNAAFNQLLGGGFSKPGGGLSPSTSVGAGGNTTVSFSPGSMGGGGFDAEKASLAMRAIDLLSGSAQISATEQLLAGVRGAPASLERDEMIKQLTDKLEQLTNATRENTDATRAMTDVLSPFYSSDPRRTYLGFRAFAGGGIMTDQGAMPLQSGIAHSRQVAVFGEGSTPEAFVPVPTGRIPVEMNMPANSNDRPINVTINVAGNADADTVNALKQTAFQQAQSMRRAMRG